MKFQVSVTFTNLLDVVSIDVVTSMSSVDVVSMLRVIRVCCANCCSIQSISP